MSVYLVSPVAPPVVEQPLRTACQHTLIGWDGSEWDVLSGLDGVKLLAGTRGHKQGPHIRYSSKSAGVDGSRWRGSRRDERTAFWPVKVSAVGSQEFLELNERFWRVLDETKINTWQITWPDGTRRYLRMRYDGLENDSSDTDPALEAKDYFGIQWVCEEPNWFGDPISRTFAAATGEAYYGGASGGGFGPPYFLSSGFTPDVAAITNRGHLDAYPVWRVDGPTTAVSAGIAGSNVTFPFDIDSGEWVDLDTNPAAQIAVDQDGNDRTDELGDVEFAAIPPGTEVPLVVAITGTGSVTVTVRPEFKRGE